ncbi:MAG TPA: hypothetical protein VIY90_14195 [Steroidobacteraceae bacterium]
MTLYSRTHARRAIFHTVGYRAISQVATPLSYVVLVRGLTEQALGVYSLLYSVIPVVATIASFGLDQVLKRYQPEFLQTGNLSGSRWLLQRVAVARLASSAALIALLLLCWNVVAPLFHLTAHRAEFLLFSLVVLLYFQTLLLQSSLASQMLQRYSVGSAALLALTKLGAYTLLWKSGQFTLRSAILADALAYGATFMFLVVASRVVHAAAPKQMPYRPSAEDKARFRRYAIINHFSDVGSLLLYVQTDNFFIAALMNPIAVGAYAFYARLNEMTANLIPIRLFENVVQPVLFAIPPLEARERLPRYFSLLINLNLIFQLPLIAYTVVYHREIVQLIFAGKFIGYSGLLPLIVALAISENVVSIPVTMIAQYTEKVSIILKSQLFGLYQVVAMLLLIPLLGLYGAAIATGTLHLFRNLYVWWHVRSYARWLNYREALASALMVWTGAIALGFLVKGVLHLSAIWALSSGVLICCAASLLYVRTAALSVTDRDILGRVMHGRESDVLRWLGVLRCASGT